MDMTRSIKDPSDRTFKRLTVAIVMILVIGIPLIGILYFLDQYRDPGPNMADRAIQSAEEAVRQNPNSVTSRFALAELYATKDRYQEAIDQYDQILKASPGTAGVIIGRGQAYVAMGELDKAAADFQSVIDAKKDLEMAKVDKQLETAYYDLGSLELQRGHAAQAVPLLSNAVAINGTDADALYKLGAALTASGDPKLAVDVVRLAVALVPTGWCEPYAGLADAYTALKDTGGAGYANGMVAMCQGDVAGARTQLTAATSGTYALDAYIGLGLLAEGQGDVSAAGAAYRQALEKDPQNFAAITGLGRVSASESAAPAPAASPSAAGTGAN